MTKDWECQFCEQTCSRKWNLNVHLKRKHARLGQPVGLSRTREDQYGNRNGLLNQQQQSPQHSSDSRRPCFRADSTGKLSEKLFLQPLGMVREFRQPLDDLYIAILNKESKGADSNFIMPATI